jgi:large subunit ribosomal protein L17
MRHHVIKHSFGRKTGPRIALIRGLVHSLVEHGRIKTTVTKAKELRRHVERAVTMGKQGTLNARRLLMARYPNMTTVETLMGDLAKRMAKRPGGYTRIVKLGPRPGDNADMAYIEFVDYEPAPAAAGGETVKGDKGATKRAKAGAKESAKRRKSVRKVQVASRRKG